MAGEAPRFCSKGDAWVAPESSSMGGILPYFAGDPAFSACQPNVFVTVCVRSQIVSLTILGASEKMENAHYWFQ